MFSFPLNTTWGSGYLKRFSQVFRAASGLLFSAYQETEERRYIGDSSFWDILHELVDSHPPLIELPPGKQLTLPTSPDQELTITPAGGEVLVNRRSWLDMYSIDRSIGGVHLTP